MKDVPPDLAKLNPRGLKVVLIGYEPRSKAYKFYDPVRGELTCRTTSSLTKPPFGSGTT